MQLVKIPLLVVGIAGIFVPSAWAQERKEPNAFQAFVQAQAIALREQDRPPQTKEEWLERRASLRERLEEAWGGFPDDPCPLEPRKLAEIQREGYRVEKLLLQTMPDVWMTALAYVPDAPGKHPAILSVHGHWRQAKVEPVIQSRCIGAAKLGYFVLAVDAFGAGERGLGKALGEYHGEMVGATLLPIGRPLSGIQVYENMRCVDYLQSRPEVDPDKIGITGASGGGNQTMYAGAWDERFGAVVPVCSVGNYQSYLSAACCMCEVVPGAISFTEESGILGLTAPRALMPCNVTRDGIQFSIREARKSIVGAQSIYDVLGVPDNLYHSTFRWKHDYHQPIREAMYGWMAQHLKGEGDGSPIPEPAHETEPPEELRCFPNDSRPDDWLTLPQFAAREGRKLLLWNSNPQENALRPSDAELRKTLIDDVLGGFPDPCPLEAKLLSFGDGVEQQLEFVSEPGIKLTLQSLRKDGLLQPTDNDIVLLLDLDGAKAVAESPLAAAFRDRGATIVTLDLRATGELAYERDRVGRAPDHNTAEWSLWIGRPLLGQWTWDVLRAIEAIRATFPDAETRRFHVVGQGPAGLVALCTGAASDRFDTVAAVNSLASFITDVPYEGQRLGILAPGIMRDVGDIAHLAGLSQSRSVLIAGGVTGGGDNLTEEQLFAQFASAHGTSGSRQPALSLTLMGSNELQRVAKAFVGDKK